MPFTQTQILNNITLQQHLNRMFKIDFQVKVNGKKVVDSVVCENENFARTYCKDKYNTVSGFKATHIE